MVRLSRELDQLKQEALDAYRYAGKRHEQRIRLSQRAATILAELTALDPAWHTTTAGISPGSRRVYVGNLIETDQGSTLLAELTEWLYTVDPRAG